MVGPRGRAPPDGAGDDGAVCGSNVRVGLRTALHRRKDAWRRATPNRWSAFAACCGDLSIEIATPAEARQRLALKGADNVGF